MKTTAQEKKYTKLLNLYFEGESSLAQEEQLRQYFQQEEIAPEHLQYAPLFQYIEQEKEGIQQANHPKKQDYTVVQIKDKNTKRYWLTGAAAAIVFLLMAGGILLIDKNSTGKYKLTIAGTKVNNEQLAVNIAKTKLNHLNSILERMSEKTEKAVSTMALPGKQHLLSKLSLSNISSVSENK